MNIKRTLLRTHTLQDFCRDHFLDIVVKEDKTWSGYWFTATFTRPVAERGSNEIQSGLGRTEETAIANLALRISGGELDIAGEHSYVCVPVLAPYKESK